MRWSFFLLVFLVVFLLSGCGERECKIDADCVVDHDCIVPHCIGGECRRILVEDCCDPDHCEGFVVYPNPSRPSKNLTAKYAQRYCDADACVIGAPPEQVRIIQLFSEHSGPVDFEMVSSISQPFVQELGNFTVTLTLTDIDAARASGAVTVSSIQVLSGSELIGQVNADAQLVGVGDQVLVMVPLQLNLEGLEEERYVSVRVSYEFRTPGDGKIDRRSIEQNYGKLLVFINPDLV